MEKTKRNRESWYPKYGDTRRVSPGLENLVVVKAERDDPTSICIDPATSRIDSGVAALSESPADRSREDSFIPNYIPGTN